MATAESKQIIDVKTLDYVDIAKERLQELGQKYAQRKDPRTFKEIKSLLKFLQEAGQQQIEYDIVNAKNKPKYNFENLKLHLENCGSLARRKWYCKQCEAEQLEALLKDEKIIQTCGVRYCNKTKCILTRFAQQIESLKNIKRLKNLKKLDHFVIGFPKIRKDNFILNFDKIKKQQERVINSFFSKLRKKDFLIQAFKVLDITCSDATFPKYVRVTDAEKKEWGNQEIYIHYHIVAIPLKSDRKRLFMETTQQIRKDMLKRQRIKIPFHIQFFGLKSKNALLSYLTIRAIGLYKFHDKKEEEYQIMNQRKLKDLLKQKKFMFLKDIVPLEFYFKNFYNHRHFTTLGGLPYGSIIMDNIISKFPDFCKRHGHLERHQVRMELIVEIPPAPPPNTSETPKIAFEYLGEAREHFEMKELLKQKSKENKQFREQKRFSRYYKSETGQKIKKSDLDFEDKLNLLSTGKC